MEIHIGCSTQDPLEGEGQNIKTLGVKCDRTVNSQLDGGILRAACLFWQNFIYFIYTIGVLRIFYLYDGSQLNGGRKPSDARGKARPCIGFCQTLPRGSTAEQAASECYNTGGRLQSHGALT